MDTLTHTLTGLALSRAMLKPEQQRWAAPCMMLAANLPDIIDFGFVGHGPGSYLRDHRGMSHAAVVGFGAAVIFATGIWLVLRILAGRAAAREESALPPPEETSSYLAEHMAINPVEEPKPPGPPGWFGLVIAITLAVATHLPLDWLNTYGVRPWLPWNGTRYFGDALFIIDPYVWLALGIAGFWGTRGWLGVGLWALLGVATTALFVYAQQQNFIPRNVLLIWVGAIAASIALRWMADPGKDHANFWSGVALVLVACYAGWMVQQSRTVRDKVMKDFGEGGIARTDPGFEISSNPVPGDPWRWTVIVQSRGRLDTLDCDLRTNIFKRVDRQNPFLDDPALDVLDARPEVQAWRAFARHPITARRKNDLILGDYRYRIGGRPDWSEQVIPIPDDVPTPAPGTPTPPPAETTPPKTQ